MWVEINGSKRARSASFNILKIPRIICKKVSAKFAVFAAASNASLRAPFDFSYNRRAKSPISLTASAKSKIKMLPNSYFYTYNTNRFQKTKTI